MRLYSTEQVSKYHPDKYADQISDAILDAYLQQDKNAHVACEALVKGKTVVVAGEITSTAKVSIYAIVRRVAQKLRYPVKKIINLVEKQSPEIAQAVKSGEDLTAGDQGMMVGFATRETKSRLPYGFDLANRIIKAIEDDVERPGSWLKGDAKTQVTVDLDRGCVYTVLISACHHKMDANGGVITVDRLTEYLKSLLHDIGFDYRWINFIVNPAGPWTVGGPEADCGLTGRKIVCDQYGGYVPVGGGAFSGKDPSKVDRSGAYAARALAMDILDRYPEVKWAEVQIAYGIGRATPISLVVKTDNIAMDHRINADVYKLLDEFKPNRIIDRLQLRNQNYEQLAEGCHYYGHDR